MAFRIDKKFKVVISLKCVFIEKGEVGKFEYLNRIWKMKYNIIKGMKIKPIEN
jgi:hypothetical protein